jgi:prepilin-type processing-associated H-X9-DG protein
MGSGAAFADDRHVPYGYDVGELLLNVHTVPFSYGYNDWGANNPQPNPAGRQQRGLGGDLWNVNSPELKASRVHKASEMIAIADNFCDGSWDYNVDPGNSREFPGKIHNNGANVLFCDGHVQWFLQKDLTTVSTATPQGQSMARIWNNDNNP